MKRSDMWDTPTVNGKLRTQSRSRKAITAADTTNYVGLEGFRIMDRPAIERLLKKSIPVLIIAFLVSVAAARGLSLLSQAMSGWKTPCGRQRS